jgi:hypothetical protein
MDNLNLFNGIYRPNLMMMFHLLHPEVLARMPPTYIGDVPSVEPPKKRKKKDLTIVFENSSSKEEANKNVTSSSSTSTVSSQKNVQPAKQSMPKLVTETAAIRPPKLGPLEFMIVGNTPVNLKTTSCYKCKQRFTSFKHLQYHLVNKHGENLELLKLQIRALIRKGNEQLGKSQS